MDIRDLLAMAGGEPEIDPRIPPIPTSDDYFRGVSPMVENVRPQQFRPMSPGSSFLDNLAMSLAANPLPPMNPNAPKRDRILGGLLSGVARGFSGARTADIQEREKLNETLRQETAQRNQRAIEANERERDRQAGINAERRAEARGVRMANLTASLREKPKTPEQIRAESRAETEGVIDAKRAAGIPLVTPDRSEDGPPGSKLTWKQIAGMNALSDDINSNNDVKNFVLRRQGYDQVISGSRQNSAAGDLALIYGFIRLQDPNAVREGEIRNVEQAQAYLRRFVNLPTKWRTGERLNPEFRRELAESATSLYKSQIPNYKRRMDQFRERERLLGIPVGTVTSNFESAEPEASDNYRVNEDGIRVRVP